MQYSSMIFLLIILL